MKPPVKSPQLVIRDDRDFLIVEAGNKPQRQTRIGRNSIPMSGVRIMSCRGCLWNLRLSRPWLAASLAVTFASLVSSTCVQASPIQIELFEHFASFTNQIHPDNRLGYRFHEHTPLTYGDVPKAGENTGNSWSAKDVDHFNTRPGIKTFHRRISEEGWIPQDWTFYLCPVADGIDLLWVVKTEDVGLPEFYGVQQCFRLTGLSNAAWRHKYAQTAAFSEFDLWKREPDGSKGISLTWALRNGTLQQLPAVKGTVGCRTPYGRALDERRSGGHLDSLQFIGPYHAKMLWTSDAGLILRTSRDQKWSTGLYWERTTHLSDHHPADCLHAIVNIGGIAPHAQRVLRGKIYWLAGPGQTVVEHWHRDFPEAR